MMINQIEVPADTDEKRVAPDKHWRIDRAFRDCAHVLGDLPAIEVSGAILSYAELEANSNRLGRRLLQEGVAVGDIVALACENVAEFAVGALAIMKLGAVYLSIDLRFSAVRSREALAAGAVRFAIGPAGFTAELAPMTVPTLENAFALETFAGFDASPIDLGAASSDLAYLCFTSGTSGIPKGALVPHSGVFGLCVHRDFSALRAPVRMASCSTFGFDAITFEVWSALLNGACIVAVDRAVIGAPREIEAAFKRLRIDCAFLTTSLFNAIIAQHPRAFGGLALVVIGGEPIDPFYVRKMFDAGAPPKRLVNGYGPTEATTFALTHIVSQEDAVSGIIPIGRAFSGRYVRILKGDLSAVQQGEAGELCLGGVAVALGYLNAPKITAEKFVLDPYVDGAESRLYRTGDLCRMRPDGLVEYLGRIDNQVKVKGYRIEPAGVAALLRKVPGVEDVLVLPRQARFGTKEIVAFLKGPQAIPLPILRAEASSLLPDYMMPADFLWVVDFPVTSNGKIDSDALMERLSREELRPVSGSRSNTLIETLLAIWRRNTRRSDVDLDTLFDEIGDSLAMIGVILDVEEELGVELSPLELDQPISLRSMANHLMRPRRVKPSDETVFFLAQPWNTKPAPVALGEALAGGKPWAQLHFRGLSSPNALASIDHMLNLLEEQLPQPRVEHPIVLAGHSYGGVLAYELARRLEAKNYPLAGVVLLDSYVLGKRLPLDLIQRNLRFALRSPKHIPIAFQNNTNEFEESRADKIVEDSIEILYDYNHNPIRAATLLVRCTKFENFFESPSYNRLRLMSPWDKKPGDSFFRVRLNCTHDEVVTDPVWIAELANVVAKFHAQLP